jgi:hypothetical protein
MAISDKTRKILWARSGNRCAECRRQLVEEATRADAESVVGDECHIVSGQSQGPRYVASFPAARLDEPDNLILLCRVHHKMVDDQTQTYTVEALQKLKATHEAWVASTLNQSAHPLEFKTACRLVAAELQDNSLIVGFALENRRWWRSDEELTTEEWKQYKSVLASHLSYDALDDVRITVKAINNASLLAAEPRPPDKPDEIFLEPTVEALTLLLKHMKEGRASLMPYLL